MKKALESYYQVIKNALFGSILIDIDGHVVVINDALLALMKLDQDKISDITDIFQYQPFVDAGIAQSLKDCKISGKKAVSDHYYQMTQDRGIYIRVNSMPIKDGRKRMAGIWAVVEDITEARQIENALKASEDKYASLVEAAMDGIVIIQDNVFKYVNYAFCNMLGMSKEELINRSSLDSIIPDDREVLDQRYKARMAGENVPNPFNVRALDKNGELLYVEFSGRVIYFEDSPADLLFVRDITARKHAEEKLNEERKWAQNYLDTAQVIILVLDEKGNIRLINRKGIEMFGYSEQEMTGKSWFDLFLPDTIREKSRAVFNLYMAGEKPVKNNFISPVIAKGNQEKNIFWYNALLKDDSGRIIGSIHSGTDVTEQLQLQEELSLRAKLLDNAIDSIYMMDEHGILLYVNENMCKTRGYKVQELLGSNIREIVTERNKLIAGERINEIFARGEYIFESEHLRKDGSSFPVEIHSRPFVINNTRYMINIARDITDRKLAEQVLSRSEERFRTILDEMDNGYFELDLHGQFIFINDAMCKILGLPRSGIVSTHFENFIDKSDEKFSTNLNVAVTDVTDKGVAVSGLFGTIVKGDGTKRIVGLSISPMKDPVGKITGVKGITRDITDRMKMEQQLMIASKLASIGELAAGVAHEINNPLTAITGFAQLLMVESELPANVKNDVEKIYVQSQRAARIVQNLLTFSRSYSLEKKTVNVNEIILKTIDMRSYEHKVNNIDVITDLATALPGISADENQIQQVIMNIIVNAEQSIIAKMRSGIIKIKTEATDDKVRMIIADNGPGISREFMDRIFDPFFTTKEVGSGTGLGLSVCHGIITQHRGNIRVESTEGLGATFTIDLPVSGEDGNEDVNIPVILSNPVAKAAGKQSVLVVDDEVVIRDILHRILTANGYEVDLAESGDEGLEKMGKRKYDAYLLDIKMPGIDGRDLYEAINRNSPELINRVIFITGDTITKSTQDFLQSTGRIYMSKPFDFSRLISSIEESIRAR